MIDEFTLNTITAYDVTGGPFAVDLSAQQLESTGAGTATKLVHLPVGTQKGGVEADVINQSHTLFGLVYGDAGNRIRLEWDVANTQVTLTVEGSSLSPVNYAGAPTTSLGIRLSGSETDWTIEVYRDGVLIDTQAAVDLAFGTDTAPAGVISDASGGTWDNLCIRDCGCAFGDEFDSLLPGYTKNPATANVFLSAGALFCDDVSTSFDDVAYYRTFTKPDDSIFNVSIEGILEKGSNSAGNANPSSGVSINGTAVTFFPPVDLVELSFYRASGTVQNALRLRYRVATVNTNITIATGLTEPVKVRLAVKAVSAGVYDFKCYLDDALIHTESSVAMSLSNPLPIGLFGIDGGLRCDEICIWGVA